MVHRGNPQSKGGLHGQGNLTTKTQKRGDKRRSKNSEEDACGKIGRERIALWNRRLPI
jgi:hypothetical protein